MTRKTKINPLWISGLMILALSTSCKHDQELANNVSDPPIDTTTNNNNNNNNGSGCSPDTVYFVQQVLPIFQSSCAMSGCHNTSSHKEGIILDSYSNIIATGGIRISNPSNSKVYRVMLNNGEDQMPPFPAAPVGSGQTAAILKWIQQGARDNSCIATGCDTANVKYSTHIKPIISNFCQGCHSGTSAGGGINLVTYDGVKAIALNGKLLGSISFLAGYSAMPKNGSKLSDCDINKINIWINAGAPNN